MNLVSAKLCMSILGISKTTLFREKEMGLIQCKKFSKKTILYDIDSYYYNDLNIDKIKNIFFINGELNSAHCTKKWLDNHKMIYTYLTSIFTNMNNIYLMLYHIKHDINDIPICEYCGFIKQFTNFREGYICKNTKCKNELKLNKTKLTCIKKYGVSSYSKTTYFILNFSLNNPAKLKIVQDKIKLSCIEKYGVDNPAKSELVKNKTKLTCLEKYGVDNVSKCNDIKSKLSSILSSDIVKLKKYDTHKHNNSFKVSYQEMQIYDILKNIYGINNVKTLYISLKYPYKCDFYILSEYLYIECNFHWTHGGKLYIGNEYDVDIVDKWKQKNSKYYNNAIVCWTKRDVEKYNCFITNNCNFLIFYSYKDAILYLDKIKGECI